MAAGLGAKNGTHRVMRRAWVVVVFGALGACKTESPAGTVVADWTYEVNDADRFTRPCRRVRRRWDLDRRVPVKLKFETEIGDLASDVHWDWPRHVHITLAEPTRAKLPQVMCMPAPPGNKVDGGVVVHPLARDGVTPTGVVACFVNGKTLEDSYAFDIDGDGQITRAVPTH